MRSDLPQAAHEVTVPYRPARRGGEIAAAKLEPRERREGREAQQRERRGELLTPTLIVVERCYLRGRVPVARVQVVLVDAEGEGRSFREAPEIDGVVRLPVDLAVGEIATVEIVDAEGPDLVAAGAGEG